MAPCVTPCVLITVVFGAQVRIGDAPPVSSRKRRKFLCSAPSLMNGSPSPKKSKSNHSGLAKKYFLAHYGQILSLGYVPINGQKLPVPRYFEKLARKHWCHFYAPGAFKDTHQRKKLYNPFKKNEQNKDIADKYILFKNIKDEKLLELQKQWDDVISHHLTTNETPDFILSGKNALYDLKNKLSQQKF